MDHPKLFRSELLNYAFYGFLFGFIFPISGSFLQAVEVYETLSVESIIAVQKSTPLLWIIDIAPVVLSIFAGFTGHQIDILNNKYCDIIDEVKDELEEELEIEQQIREELVAGRKRESQLIIDRVDALLEVEESRQSTRQSNGETL